MLCFQYHMNRDGVRLLMEKKVDIEKGADTFIVLPVEKGDNEIVLKYKVPWVGIGVIITLVTLSIFGMSCWLEWRKKSKTNMKFDKNNSI